MDNPKTVVAFAYSDPTEENITFYCEGQEYYFSVLIVAESTENLVLNVSSEGGNVTLEGIPDELIAYTRVLIKVTAEEAAEIRLTFSLEQILDNE